MDAAAELYGADPDDFVGLRKEQVTQARKRGDKDQARAIAALRKPSQSAWLVNQLVRRRSQEMRRLLALASDLRKAQEGLDAAALRRLSGERRGLLADFAHEARSLADELGHPLTDPVEREVVETLESALADPDSARQVEAGQLTRALRYAGFGELVPPDLPDHLADEHRETPAARQTDAVASPVRPAEDTKATRLAEEESQRRKEAVAVLAAAEQADAMSGELLLRAEQECQQAAHRVERLEKELAAAKDALRRARLQAKEAVERKRGTECQLESARSSTAG